MISNHSSRSMASMEFVRYWRELEPYLYRLAEDEGLQPHYSAAFGRLRDDHRVGDIVVDLETRYKRSGMEFMPHSESIFDRSTWSCEGNL